VSCFQIHPVVVTLERQCTVSTCCSSSENASTAWLLCTKHRAAAEHNCRITGSPSALMCARTILSTAAKPSSAAAALIWLTNSRHGCSGTKAPHC
jgi:hypothetical protein